MVFEKCNEIVEQVDTIKCDLDKIISSPSIKILLKFDIGKSPNKNFKQICRLVPKIESLEYLFIRNCIHDLHNADPLTVSEIKGIVKGITVYIKLYI